MLLFALALTGCVEDVGTDKTKAIVTDVPAQEAPKAEPQGTVKLEVDPSRSTLHALGAKITRKHPIDFKEFTGEVDLAGNDVVGVNFTAKVASLVADDDHLTEHLKKPDFLDATAFPTATFASTEVKAGSNQPGMTHTVTGDLTIRGQTKRVTFPAKIAVDDKEVKASTEFVINRQDFKVTYPGKPDDLVQDNVVMTIDFVAPRS